MSSEGSVTRYAHEIHSPDPLRREEAARQIWLRFSARLGALVRRRLDPRILRRAGEEDVVQSLFASYFAAGPSPNGPPGNRAEVWRLLVHFAVCKVANTADRHRAARRDVRREVSLEDLAAGRTDADQPRFDVEDLRVLGPEDVVVAREQFERLMASLPQDLQDVLVMKLEGHTNAEIGAKIGRVERTVELKMKAVRGLLRPYLDAARRDAAVGDDLTR
ncbi:MAG: ECF-type sigma factor [Isosphaeraceae bacterium]